MNHLLATALTGGVLTELQGGQFGHGFLAAGVGFGVGQVGQTQGWRTETQFVASVVSAGTVSEITGGKFANGALTAAFAYVVAHGVNGLARAAQEKKDGFFTKLKRVLNFKKMWEFKDQGYTDYRDGVPLAHERAAYDYGRYLGSPTLAGIARTIGEFAQLVGYGVETLSFGYINILPESHNIFTADYLLDSLGDIQITIEGARGTPFEDVVNGRGGVP